MCNSVSAFTLYACVSFLADNQEIICVRVYCIGCRSNSRTTGLCCGKNAIDQQFQCVSQPTVVFRYTVCRCILHNTTVHSGPICLHAIASLNVCGFGVGWSAGHQPTDVVSVAKRRTQANRIILLCYAQRACYRMSGLNLKTDLS